MKIAGHNVYSSQKSDAMSDLATANAEALACYERGDTSNYGASLEEYKLR